MFIKGNPSVYIDENIKNGKYILDSNSSTGKTYLYKTLNNMRQLNENVVGYSYIDFLNKGDLVSILRNEKPKVVMIDRYNRFYTDKRINDALQEYTDGIVLISFKGNINPLPYTGDAEVILDKDVIKVELL